MKQTALRRAANHLIKKGIIEYDKDIARDLGLTHGPISTYLRGTATPSKPFLKAFESFYNIKIAEFEGDEAPISDDHPADMRTKYIERIDELLDSSLKRVEEKLDQLDKSQATLYSFLEVLLEEVIASRAKTEKQAQEISLSAHKRFAEKLTKIH